MSLRELAGCAGGYVRDLLTRGAGQAIAHGDPLLPRQWSRHPEAAQDAFALRRIAVVSCSAPTQRTNEFIAATRLFCT